MCIRALQFVLHLPYGFYLLFVNLFKSLTNETTIAENNRKRRNAKTEGAVKDGTKNVKSSVDKDNASEITTIYPEKVTRDFSEC